MNQNHTTAEVEQGPLRPPSEAKSLLIRVVRNCPWNKCSFCPAYKNEKFSLRNTDEILNEINTLVLNPDNQDVSTIFLQDGDALVAPVENLLDILKSIKHNFPNIDRVTAYSRSRTLKNRSVEDLKKLKDAGLTRIHVGLESGCNEVLDFVKKGTNSTIQLEGCKRVKDAGLELCCYVMPGLGGKKYSEKHAIDTGKLIAEIEPEHVRLRTCFVLENTPLADDYNKGRFIPLSEEETVKEIRLFLTMLPKTNTNFISDHRINLLLELRGNLPCDYEKMINTIDRFLNLDEEAKALFIAGRRLGLIRKLNELSVPEIRNKINIEKHKYNPEFPVPINVLY